MKKETLKALKGSIRKWKEIVAGTEEDKAYRDCPLCQRFSGEKITCHAPDGKEACPVVKKVKNDACKDTPYQDWHSHGRDKHRTSNHPEYNKKPHSVHPDCLECLKLAKAEIEFLKSLLPKKSKGGR